LKGQKSPIILKVNKKVTVKGAACEVDPIAKQRKLDGVKVITTILERESSRKKSFLYTSPQKGRFCTYAEAFVTKL